MRMRAAIMILGSIALTVLLLATPAQALQCYSCGNSCGGQNYTLADKQECAVGESCYKEITIYRNDESTKQVKRGCERKYVAGSCDKIEDIMGYSREVCICDDKILCNSTPSNHPASSYCYSALVVLALIIKLW